MREALKSPHPLSGAPVWVAAVGKAAAAMAQGAHEALGAAIEHTLVITRDAASCDAVRGLANVEVLLGAHPLPDERSLAAGARLCRWVEELPATARPLFLISGGASSLVEVLLPGVTLASLRALNQAALSAGLSIGEFNARRIALSAIKGGRLAALLGGRSARALFVSDVPQDDPAVIGSGLMAQAADGPDRIERTIVASIDDAVAAVAAAAAAHGLSVHVAQRRFADSALRVAARCAHELSLQPAQLCVWGGESTVTPLFFQGRPRWPQSTPGAGGGAPDRRNPELRCSRPAPTAAMA